VQTASAAARRANRRQMLPHALGACLHPRAALPNGVKSVGGVHDPSSIASQNKYH
jgi:hypothetical protein